MRVLTMKISSLILLILSTGVGACIAKPSNSSPGRADEISRLVDQALMAQVRGPGGCDTTGTRASGAIPFFPGVQFWSMHCEAEHGDTLTAIAATDSAGIVYLLDTQTGFAFLASAHRPALLDDARVARYTEVALALSGYAPGGLLRDARGDFAPAGAASATVVHARPGFWLVSVHIDATTVHERYLVIVMRSSGQIAVSRS